MQVGFPTLGEPSGSQQMTPSTVRFCNGYSDYRETNLFRTQNQKLTLRFFVPVFRRFLRIPVKVSFGVATATRTG